MAQHLPGEVAVEEVFLAKSFQSALALGEARGVALLAAAAANLEVFEYSAAEVKKAVVGYGRADKHQVQAMVKRLLGLKELPLPIDAADALAVAICHLNSRALARLR
jgi:crossover junction endodeoxyribonuclease RuvC